MSFAVQPPGQAAVRDHRAALRHRRCSGPTTASSAPGARSSHGGSIFPRCRRSSARATARPSIPIRASRKTTTRPAPASPAICASAASSGCSSAASPPISASRGRPRTASRTGLRSRRHRRRHAAPSTPTARSKQPGPAWTPRASRGCMLRRLRLNSGVLVDVALAGRVGAGPPPLATPTMAGRSTRSPMA